MDLQPNFTGLVAVMVELLGKGPELPIDSPDKVKSMRRGDTVSIRTHYKDLFMGINPKDFEGVFHSYNSENNYATFLCKNADGRISSVQVDVNRINYDKDKLELPVNQFVEFPVNRETMTYRGYDISLKLVGAKDTFF